MSSLGLRKSVRERGRAISRVRMALYRLQPPVHSIPAIEDFFIATPAITTTHRILTSPETRC
jgi:hypothetical protein